MRIFNTLTRQKEEFVPVNVGKVGIYVCGPTVYNFIHVGNARPYVVFDTLRRYLEHLGNTVTFVQNFTDIDDKIIDRASKEKVTPVEIAEKYIKNYFEQTEKLNILKATDYPRVTDTDMMQEIVRFIQTLMDKGFAYKVGGDVYFSVEKFKDYGKLSKRNLEDLKAGAGASAGAFSEVKKDAHDFALWKGGYFSDKPDNIKTWPSPWGAGRPGWHIECSVMSSKLLGDTIDIHGGGQDLIFPHHENEIAQSEAATGKQFVKYWIHNGFVTINKEKMSKSLNNFFTLREIFEKYDPRVVRYYLLTQHYKSPLDFSDEGLNAAKNALQGLDDAYLRLSAAVKENAGEVTNTDLKKLKENFLEALDDDFNSEKALARLHEVKSLILNELFKSDSQRLSQLKKLFEESVRDSLGITLPEANCVNEDLQNLLEQRNAARIAKNWQEADKLRNLLDEKGYKIVDNKDGSSVLVKKI